MNPKQRKAGTVVSWAITIFLIIIWGALVAFVGGVSNVDSLCNQASWLAWVCRLPAAALGTYQASSFATQVKDADEGLFGVRSG
jgi:hypothetical protein